MIFYRIPEDLDEEKRIIYLPIVTYLKLKNRQYVLCDRLTKYISTITPKVFMNLIAGLKNVIGEELYKNEIQTYVIEEIE